MKISKAKTSDVSALYNLERELFNSKNYPLSKASFYYHAKNSLLLLAKVDDVLAGYILILIKRKDAKLYSIGVKESFRGRGISKVLLQKASKHLEILEFKKFILEVRVDNIVAISLYEKNGFKIVKSLKAFYKDDCDAYVMELNYGDKEL
ncbi:MAG: ribosomal protein S18-alanine N-acetyltransferase [Sulfurimonas sp.]|uniref:ribosomal protein S18-alanine N-acetyltransferase n=1 Tax=Sulfurimonas sp. TaxID=2022749 RepID=UPI0025D10DF2|nr:ribosomal protein S18-alanine N-acetyltransferase [Sulfurimonas sp.]MCK9490776.1 ribosomal protein S18-alanine N-acetyltransferase [Sulfurimonas sp.]